MKGWRVWGLLALTEIIAKFTILIKVFMDCKDRVVEL